MCSCCAIPRTCDAYRTSSIRWWVAIDYPRSRICSICPSRSQPYSSLCAAAALCHWPPRTRPQGKLSTRSHDRQIARSPDRTTCPLRSSPPHLLTQMQMTPTRSDRSFTPRHEIAHSLSSDDRIRSGRRRRVLTLGTMQAALPLRRSLAQFQFYALREIRH